MDRTTANFVPEHDAVGFSKDLIIQGNERVKKAVGQFARYGKILFSREQNFKSTRYAFHFINPVGKFRQLYNLRDNVLILCCNDSLLNFKGRTKDFIDYLIAEYKNRLDKVTCFLVDDCAEIEDVIISDRTSNPDTRLIVPFSYAELEEGFDENKFQLKLRRFLYERDLFGIATPLKSESYFFGKDRTNIISELYGKYKQGEHGGLFGLRRIGKTSILNLLQQRVEQDNGVVIYFDCSMYHHQRWNTFLREIIRGLHSKYAYSPEITTSLTLPRGFSLSDMDTRYNEERAPLSFKEDLALLNQQLNNTRILLIFDEIEKIGLTTSPSEHWKKGNDSLFFWEVLRSISQTDNGIFSFVITGVNPMSIELGKINGTPNPIFNILTPIYITLFSLVDVKEMVSSIGGYLGLHFEEEIFTKLIEDYGGHPFLTRQLCSLMNTDLLKRNVERPHVVSRYSYEKYAQDYQVKGVANIIKEVLDVLEDYYPNEFLLLKRLAIDGRDTFAREMYSGENAIPHLLGYCLIEKDEGDYHIRIKAVEEYLKSKYKYDKTLSTQTEKRERLHARRSRLELKLREIIANNIKLRYGRKAKDTLIKQLDGTTSDKTQETKLLNAAGLSEAMEELYFSQLRDLMKKDWKSYQTVFPDQRRFDFFFDEINSKVRKKESHSARIDEEAEAIINAAFNYFDEALFD